MSVTASSLSVGGGWMRGEVEPLAGSARLRPAPVTELAVWNRAAFVDGLTLLGIGTDDLDEAVRLRDDVAGEVGILDDEYAAIARASYRPSTPPEAIAIAEQRRTAFQRLSDWFAARRCEVLATTTVELRVPLFVVAAPDVPGCRVALWPTGRPPTALAGRFTLHGAGGGATGHVTTAGCVGVEHGQRKVVFAPVTAQIAEVRVYDDGRPVGHGIRVAISTAPNNVETGILRLAPDANPPLGALADTYPLGDDASGDVFAFERIRPAARCGTRDVPLGFTAFGVDAAVVASVSMTRPTVLTLELASGSDYDLHDLAQGHGIAWQSEVGERSPSCS